MQSNWPDGPWRDATVQGVSRDDAGNISTLTLVYDDYELCENVTFDHVRRSSGTAGPPMEEVDRRKALRDMTASMPGERVLVSYTDRPLKEWWHAIVQSVDYNDSTVTVKYAGTQKVYVVPKQFVRPLLPRVGDRVLGKWAVVEEKGREPEEMELRDWYKAKVVRVDREKWLIGLEYDDGDVASFAPPVLVKPDTEQE